MGAVFGLSNACYLVYTAIMILKQIGFETLKSRESLDWTLGFLTCEMKAMIFFFFYLIGMWYKLNVFICVKFLEHHLAYNKFSIK